MATLAQPDVLETAIRAIVESVPLPKGVKFGGLRFGEDHSGYAAVYLTYKVSKKVPLTKTRVTQLGVLSNAVTDAIWNLGADPIPYIDFQDAR